MPNPLLCPVPGMQGLLVPQPWWWAGGGWVGAVRGSEHPILPYSWLYNLLAPLLQRTLQQQLNKEVGACPLCPGVSLSPPAQ